MIRKRCIHNDSRIPGIHVSMIFFLLIAAVFYQQSLYKYISPLMLLSWLAIIPVLFKEKRFNINLVAILILFLLIPITGLLNVILSGNSYLIETSVLTLFHKLTYILPLGVLYYVQMDRKYGRYVIIILATIIITMCIQLIQMKTRTAVFSIDPTHPSFAGHMGTLSYHLKYYLAHGIYRVPAFFSEPADAAIFAVFLGVPFLGAVRYGKSTRVTIIILVIAIILFSRSLNPLIALCCCMMVYIFRNVKVSTLLLSLTIFIPVGIALFSERITAVLSFRDPSFLLRLSSVESALVQQMKSSYNLILGFGLGNNSKFGSVITDTSIKSDYVRYLFDGGIIGLFLYLVFILFLYQKSRPDSAFRYFLIALIVLGILNDTQALYYLPLLFVLNIKLEEHNAVLQLSKFHNSNHVEK